MLFRSQQKTAYEMVSCDWSSDVCSSDLRRRDERPRRRTFQRHLAAMKNVASEQKAVAAELSAYLAARERAWTKTAEALRRHDQAAAQAANQELQDAARKLELLGGEEEESPRPAAKDAPRRPMSP